jgi:hypothetical protein
LIGASSAYAGRSGAQIEEPLPLEALRREADRFAIVVAQSVG